MNEAQPLLGHIEEYEYQNTTSPLVDFDPKYDPENPRDWSPAYKRGIVSLLAFMAFTVTFTCIGLVPVASRIVMDLEGHENPTSSILLVTIWELGEAAGPLLIAPLSEIYGRYPVFNLCNALFIIGSTAAALAPSTPVLIFARFVTGFAVAGNVLNPAIIGDIFPAEEQGAGMSLVMLAPLLGGAIGPAISGAIAETLGWRWVLWVALLVAVTCEIFFFVLLKETYKVPILQRRAARLRAERDDDNLKCAWDAEDGSSAVGWNVLATSIKRPVIILWDSVVLQILALYGGLFFSLYYILATTLPGILKDIYGFSPALIGSSFLPFSTGAALGILVSNIYLDKIYVALGKARGGPSRPEDRLPFMICSAIAIPIVLFLYGYSAHLHLPVALLLFSVGLLGFTFLGLGIPLSLYVVDAFGVYSASAMTMVLVARCLGGTLLPLVMPPLERSLGLGGGFAVIALALVVCIPAPVLVRRYGAVWRQRSAYTGI